MIMKPITSNLTTNNAQDAISRAQSSNRSAFAARTARDERNFILEVLDDWARIFTNSPIGILTTLFFFAVGIELLFSWPMYSDLMSQMLGSSNAILSLIGGAFIVLWGAYVSHLLAKKMSPPVFDYSVYNEMKFSKNAIPKAAAEEKARVARHRDFIKGLILGILLLTVVAAISWQRVWLMGAITGSDYSLTHKLLPVIAVLIEIISGIYVGYLIRRFNEKSKAKKLHKEFVNQKNNCAYETNMAHEHYQHALRTNEKVHFSKELRDALYRFEQRSQDTDGYVNDIPVLKTLKVVVADENGLLQGVHLAGVLGNGEYCNSIWTNDQGEGILTWENDAKEVLAVYTDNEQHKGPFRENSKIRLDLKRQRQVSSA